MTLVAEGHQEWLGPGLGLSLTSARQRGLQQGLRPEFHCHSFPACSSKLLGELLGPSPESRTGGVGRSLQGPRASGTWSHPATLASG